ncbi:MAG TPA: response regulator transcription factor [Thermoleophilaceae bacterium]
MSVEVLLVDDQELVRTGLRSILDRHDDIEVVGEADDGERAVEASARLRPDLVVMDIRMPGMDGLEATRRLVSQAGHAPRVLVLTTFDLDEYVYEALRAGASGFMLKGAPADQLVHAVRVVADGEALISPSVTRRLLDEFAGRPRVDAAPPAALEELTARERDVLDLMAKGLSNPEIAEELVVTPATVKTHVAHILMKLGVRDRVQAVILLYESGVIEPGRS